MNIVFPCDACTTKTVTMLNMGQSLNVCFSIMLHLMTQMDKML